MKSLIRQVWGVAQDSAFPTSSQLIPKPMVYGLQLESQGLVEGEDPDQRPWHLTSHTGSLNVVNHPSQQVEKEGDSSPRLSIRWLRQGFLL